MSAPHFFVPSLDGPAVRIEGEDGRHAVRVLRVRAGERVSLSDGAGGLATAVAATLDGDAVVCEIDGRERVPPPRPALDLFVAVPKAGKLDLVVQKATEIGVASVVPWFASRSVPRWDARRTRAQAERLRAIARAAAKQSHRAWLPSVAEPGPLAALPSPSFVLHEEASDRLLDALPGQAPERIGLVVGPEGGLGPADLEQAAGMGARVAGLGRAILRAETAAIVAPALVLARYGGLG